MPLKLLRSAPRCLGRRPSPAILPLSASPTTPATVILRSFSTSSPMPAAPATSPLPSGPFHLPDDYVPPTQPPSARPPDTRKSQQIRLYASLLRTSPLILFFQHNNLTSKEWTAVRRELRKSLATVPPLPNPDGVGPPIDVLPHIKLEVLRVRMFDVALKLVEFYSPNGHKGSLKAVASSTNDKYIHDLSQHAYEVVKQANLSENPGYAQIAPILTGPVAGLIFPAVSPAHIAAALSALAPSPPQFPPPTRRKNPGYYDPIFQNAMAKLLLIGGRIEGKTFDTDGVKWIGSIEGGLEGLRAQLVHLLQSAGLGLMTTLEGASKSLWLSLESRRTQMDEEQNGAKAKKGEASS